MRNSCCALATAGSRAGGGAIATLLGARSFFTLGGDCFIVASMVSNLFINAENRGSGVRSRSGTPAISTVPPVLLLSAFGLFRAPVGLPRRLTMIVSGAVMSTSSAWGTSLLSSVSGSVLNAFRQKNIASPTQKTYHAPSRSTVFPVTSLS